MQMIFKLDNAAQPLFVCMLLTFLMGCGHDNVIGKVYGAEHEYITIGEDTFTVCVDSDYHSKDRNKKIGMVEFDGIDTDPMVVYSIKGVDNNDYIYVLWVYDGYIYKKDKE